MSGYAVVGHFVATDGDWPDNLGKLDEGVTVKAFWSREQAESALAWYPDGQIVSLVIPVIPGDG